MEAGGKRAIAIWHRRAGKDSVCLNWAATQTQEAPAVYWHMLPKANQARKAIWDAVNPHTGKRLIDQAFPKELRSNTRENDMSIRFKSGAMWQVVGSDNFNALVGSPPKGIVFSEWALSDSRAWGILRPILLENNGWALFITTPRGFNHAHRMLRGADDDPTWFSEVLTVDETGVFTPEQIEQERLEYIREYGEEEGEDLFNQEYYCSFESAIRGAYYRNEMKAATDRIGNVPYDKAVPVHTSWDIGVGDSTAIWFWQFVGQERHLIDYEEASGVGVDAYVKILKNKPYIYGQHVFPHDVKAREWGNDGRSRVDTLKGLGIEAKVLPIHKVDDGIQKVRQIFDQCWFDKTRCERGLDALKNYRREWDEVTKVYKRKPEHDWTSHGADSFRYGAMGLENRISTYQEPDYFPTDMPM